jgi:RHS repeat-associated protein
LINDHWIIGSVGKGRELIAAFFMSGAAASYAWDPLGRMLNAVQGQNTVSFAYDYLGRRIAKNNAFYVYDGPNIVAQVDAAGAISQRFLHGAGTDEHLAVHQDGQWYYYHQDGLGSVMSLTDTAGSIAAAYSYSSFGNSTQDTGALDQPYRYTGREWDSETGLYFYRARYYDPTIGRFISEDPIGFKGSGTDFYAYVRNNPTNLIDSLGLKVTIVIGDRTYSPTGNSVAGTITVTSDETSGTFSGYTMENANGGDGGNKPPIPSGTYDAFVRTDHTPNRIELKNVPGYQNMQIHNGRYPRNFKGCFGAGTSHSTDFLGGTVNAINQINSIISADGTGDIKVIVGPVQ